MKHSKLFFVVSALLLVAVLVFSRAGYPWSSTGGDGTNYGMVRETAVFFNNSGGALTCGTIVIVDTQSTESGSGATLQQAVSAGSTMGSYVTTTTTADVSGVVGVVLSGTTGSSCTNQTGCVVVTKGVAQVLILDSTDPVNTGDIVGTSSTAGYGGEYTSSFSNDGFIGKALEAGDGSDTSAIWVYVNPH